MKTSMQSKLDQLARRLADLNGLLSHEDATSDMDQYRKLTREHAEIGPIVEQYGLWRQALTDEATAQDLLADPSMRDFAEDEIGEARTRMAKIEGDLQTHAAAERPERRAQYLHRNPRGYRRRRIGAVRGRPAAHVSALRGAQPLVGRDDVGKRIRSRRLQGSDRADRGPGRVFAAQVRIGRTSRAARARRPKRRGASIRRRARSR